MFFGKCMRVKVSLEHMVCFRSLILIHRRLLYVAARRAVIRDCSREAGLFEKEEEGALLKRCRAFEGAGGVLTVFPALEPFGVLRAELNVVLVAVRLEEKLLVAPERGNSLRARHDVTNELFFATKLRRLVIGHNLEKSNVRLENLQLVVEIVLVGISPAIDIIRLELNHEWPVRLRLSVAVLVVQSQVHKGVSTDVVSGIGEPLGISLTSASVLWRSENIGPTVFEVVE